MPAKGERIKKSIADVFDIPKDIVLNLPRIVIIGQLQVYIENHEGVEEFKEDYIKIRIPQGIIQIKGKNLLIKNIYAEDLLLDGEISCIKFNK